MAVLAVAILTGSTVIALLVIGLAAVGLFLLARDWLKELKAHDTSDTAQRQPDGRQPEEEVARGEKALNADMFEPDVSYEEAIESDAEDEEFDVEDEGDNKT